ncbi:MAG: DUF2191 domain-containing protein [Syntrophus sp. (in: bacteria)]|nr:DUF2191 domain-containing protein [Syntrophus sp. (in: bacteria)]
MKVTAIIPDQLIEEVKRVSGAKNITESLIVALQEWTAMKRLKQLNAEIEQHPLLFHKNLNAESLRAQNRKR